MNPLDLAVFRLLIAGSAAIAVAFGILTWSVR